MARKLLTPPISYFGGKTMHANRLVDMIPQHIHYVEVFGGSGGLLFAKEPSDLETYNDIDSGVVNLYRVIRDKNKLEDFKIAVQLIPYSREFYNEMLETYRNSPETLSDVEKAAYFFALIRMAISNILGNTWGNSKTCVRRKMSSRISAYLGAVEKLDHAYERLCSVQIENQDFRKILENYDTENTFFYLDPPYLPETRVGGGYKYEMSLEDHQDMVEILKNIKGKVLLSGYDNKLYDSLGWNKHSWDTFVKTAISDESKRVEFVWYNYDLPHIMTDMEFNSYIVDYATLDNDKKAALDARIEEDATHLIICSNRDNKFSLINTFNQDACRDTVKNLLDAGNEVLNVVKLGG